MAIGKLVLQLIKQAVSFSCNADLFLQFAH